MEGEPSVTGEVVMDITTEEGAISMTAADLQKMIENAALVGYNLAERKRRSLQTTPDGLLDKTIAGYTPAEYNHSALENIPNADVEWHGADAGMPGGNIGISAYQEQVARQLLETHPGYKDHPELIERICTKAIEEHRDE